MSGFKVYIMLLFGISIFLYLFGYTSPLLQMATATSGTDVATGLLNSFIGVFTNPVFLGILGASAIASYLTSGTNFSAVYLLPMFLIMAMLNYFVLPTSFVLALDLDPLIKIIVLGFLNLLLALSMMDFVRGG